jgi:hypothetical protein
MEKISASILYGKIWRRLKIVSEHSRPALNVHCPETSYHMPRIEENQGF